MYEKILAVFDFLHERGIYMAGILSIQFTPAAGDKERNFQKVCGLIEKFADRKLDLIVIPEFFSTGICDDAFINSPEDSKGGAVVEFFSKIARRYKTNIVCGTASERDGEKLYNTSFVLNRSGVLAGRYRKIHLYNFFGGNEGTYTDAGSETLVVDLDFAKVGVSVCFDIKFPLLYRDLIKQGAEIIVSPSAWSILASAPEKEKEIFIKTWEAMNICRATESLVYFVTSNLTGRTAPYLESIGHSMITGPYGEVICNAGEEEGGTYADVDLKVVRDLKGRVPVALME